MPSLSSIAAGVRQSASDSAFEVRVLREAGIVGLMRPDKFAKIGMTFLRWGASPALGIAAAAIHHPDATAIIDERGSLTFEQLHRRSNALAHALEKMGIGYGDGVGIMCRNHRGFVEATLAAAKLGASALYLNTMFAGPQLVEVMRREGPKALVYDEEFGGLLDGVDGEVQRVIAWTDGEPEEPTIDALIAANEDSNLKPPPDKPRFVILTSGTTGTPKGAQRSNPDGLLAMAAIIDKIPYRARETMMIAAPLFHSWGFFHFVISLPTASTIVLRRRFDPEATLQATQDHGAQVLGVVPVMLQRILQLPDETLDRFSLPSLADHLPLRLGAARRARARLDGPLRRLGLQPLRLDRGLLGDRRHARRPARRARHRRPAPARHRRQALRRGRDGGPEGRGRANLRRQRNGLRGLHRRRRQGGDRRPLQQRRRRPPRRSRPALHRRPRRRDDRLRRRERLPARGRGPARRPRGAWSRSP